MDEGTNPTTGRRTSAEANIFGGSGGGHYWAYCRNNDSKWYKYNDNIVSHLNPDKVVSPEAYCLFYKLKN